MESSSLQYLAEVAAGAGGFVIRGDDIGGDDSITASAAGDVNGDGLDDVIINDSGWRNYVVFSPVVAASPSEKVSTVAQ